MHRDSSWNSTCIEAWTLWLDWNEERWLASSLFGEPEVNAFKAWCIGKLCSEDCEVLWHLSHSRWPFRGVFATVNEKMPFYLHEHETVFFETNRKQTTCTNEFSMCLTVCSFVLWRLHSKFQVWDVREHPLRDACVWTHFSSQGKLGSK